MRKDEELSLDKMIQESLLYDSPLTEKQKDILLAAESLFAEQGYSDTPTAEIARKAGVTEKTLFKHFPTKADLLKRVMFPLLLRFVVPTQIKHIKVLIQNSGPNPEDIFKAIFRDRLALAQQHHGKIRFVIVELLKNDSLRAQFAKIWEEQLLIEITRIIDQMKKEGKVRKDIKTETVVRAMISLVASYVISSQLFTNKWNHEQDLTELATILTNGIKQE